MKPSTIEIYASTYYIHINTKILADIQFCISVPLMSTRGPAATTADLSKLFKFLFKKAN